MQMTQWNTVKSHPRNVTSSTTNSMTEQNTRTVRLFFTPPTQFSVQNVQLRRHNFTRNST